jgi:RNA polymerase sigma-70 factor, ECF subfamily
VRKEGQSLRPGRVSAGGHTLRISDPSGTFLPLATFPRVQHTFEARLAKAFQPPMVIDNTVHEKTPSDEALMLEFQAGSRAAFTELFARYHRPLFGFFRRRLNHAADTRAEDLTQDTFVVVLRATERYQPRALVRTYLYGIAFNLLANERRRQLRDAPHSSPPPERGTTPDTADVVWIRQALAKLELSEREILMLREYEQLSYAEIAELLELPINTVRSRLFRARMALKGLLEARTDLPGLRFAQAQPTALEKTASPSRSSKSEPISELRPAEDEGLR